MLLNPNLIVKILDEIRIYIVTKFSNLIRYKKNMKIRRKKKMKPNGLI